MKKTLTVEPKFGKSQCLWRIDILSDSTRDRCPSEALILAERTPCSSETIKSANRAAVTSSNSEWLHGECSLPISAGNHREHESLKNQAATGV
jgi:hypothetical protein